MKLNFSVDPAMLDTTFFKNLAWGWARHGLGGAGVYLVGQGLMSNNGWHDLYGAGAFVFALAWSAYDKWCRTGEVFGKSRASLPNNHGRP